MQLVLAFHGSRGDVQPGVALGRTLADRGHSVVLAVPPNLVEFAARSGLDARACGPDTGELLASDLVVSHSRSRNPVRRGRAIAELALQGGLAAQADLMDLAAGTDAIVGGSVGQERVLNVSEALGVPYLPIHLCPMRSNRSVALVAPWGRHLGPRSTRASWWLIEQALWWAGRGGENRLRAELGLPTAHGPTARRIVAQGVPEVQAYDPAMFADLGREWGQRRPLVGFLDLDPATRAMIGDAHDTDDLDDWLDAGPAPVYIGFGSMSAVDPHRLAAAVLDGTAGHRVLVATGWSDFLRPESLDPDVRQRLVDSGDRIRVVRTVDHATVLPRCAVAVHHGGAGSTAAALRSGLPTVICWLGADQPLWGRAVTRLGVGTAFSQATVSAETLRDAIARVDTPSTRDAAAALRRRLVPADAAANGAAAVVESTVAQHQ
ncbi:glycosyltransferase [Williamsia herbipolensis]|uniref:Glycosyltransferase n=1 Tax=Williamsia herbipolensis TaxID=1603258 RepID=A0AAU4K2E3_9NOCA|nr:glycosyltransferase [Williamsia herbipolensis]